MRAAASRLGIELGEIVVEEDVSGSLPAEKRRLGEVLTACEEGRSGGVIVSNIDRLTRASKLDEAMIFERLSRAGARFVAANDGVDTASPGSELTLDILAAIARQQWRRHRDNWANARRNAVERGMHPCGHLPFGYTDTDGDRKLVPDGEKAEVVRAIFRLRAQRASWRELLEYAESTGVEPRGGGRYAYRLLESIVSNRVYLGEAFTGDFRNPTAHEPLVSRSVWLAAQTRQPGRITRGTEGARLTGIVFCASCGRRLTPGSGKYRCIPRPSKHKEPCTSRASATMERLDELVVSAFLERYEEAIGSFDDGPKAEESPELAPLVRQVERARHVLDTHVGDPASLAVLSSEKRTELLANAQREVDEAEQALDEAMVRHETGMRNVLNVWSLSDAFEVDGFAEARVSEQRRILTAAIAGITVKRGVTKGEPLGPRVTIAWRD